MNARELMIGDWVYCRHEVTMTIPASDSKISLVSAVETKKRRVEGIKEVEVIFSYYSDTFDRRQSFTEAIENISPIPLTDEILLVNDFQLFQEREHAPIYYRKGIGIKYHYHGKYYYIDSDYCIIKINYVHELQHILYSCRLNDIADNFKVE